MSRSWLLYLDDSIAGARKTGRLTRGRTLEPFVADEAAFASRFASLPLVATRR